MANLIVVGVGIALLLAGIILFFIFSNREKYRRPSAIRDYVKQRDELTLDSAKSDNDGGEEGICAECEEPLSECTCEDEEDEEEEDDDESPYATQSSGIIGMIFGIAIIIFVGFFLMSDAGQVASGIASNGSVNGFRDVVVDGLGEAGKAMTEWLDIIVLLIVMGFIIGMFVKMGNMFNDGFTPELKDKKDPRVTKKPHAMKHYTGMRDELTRISAKRTRRKRE